MPNTTAVRTAQVGAVPFFAGKNTVINGGMDVFQRGTSSTAIGSGTFLADRWQAVRAGFAAGASQSRQATSDTTNLPNIQYCLRVQRDSANTSTAQIYVGQNFETVNSIPLAGKTIILSFYARKGANYSATSNVLGLKISTGTGTDQNVITGSYTGQVDLYNTTAATLTTTWTRYSVSVTIGVTATQVGFYFDYQPVGTAGANDYFEVTGVQLELGTTATTFSRNAGTIQGELAACQRYYFLKASGTDLSYGMAAYNSASDLRGSFSLPVEMRIAPTLIAASGTNYYIGMNSDAYNSLTQQFSSKTEITWYNVSEVSGVAGYAMPVRTNNAASSIALSAEL